MSERRSYVSLSRLSNGYTEALLSRSRDDVDDCRSIPCRDPQTRNALIAMPAESRSNAEPVGGGSLVRQQIQRLYGEKSDEKPGRNNFFVQSLAANSSRQVSHHENGDKFRSVTTRTSVLNSSVVTEGGKTSSSVPAVFRLLRPAFRDQLKSHSNLVPLNKGHVEERPIPIKVESRDNVDLKLNQVLLTQRRTEVSPKQPMTKQSDLMVIPIERTYEPKTINAEPTKENHVILSPPPTDAEKPEAVSTTKKTPEAVSTTKKTPQAVSTTTKTTDAVNATKKTPEPVNTTVTKPEAISTTTLEPEAGSNATLKPEDIGSAHEPTSEQSTEANGLLTTIVEEGSEASEQDALNKTRSSDGFEEEGNETKIDGNYFIKLIENETFKFEEQILEFEEDLAISDGLSPDDPKRIPDEARDSILATVGKAKLLMAQKMAQFRGLCEKNMAASDAPDPFVPTADDLAGFWDMVSLQVADIHSGFQELRRLRERGWVKTEEKKPQPKKVGDGPPRRRVVKNGRNAAANKAPSEASKARDEARRKMLEEKKRLLKQARMAKGSGTENNSEEIFVQF